VSQRTTHTLCKMKISSSTYTLWAIPLLLLSSTVAYKRSSTVPRQQLENNKDESWKPCEARFYPSESNGFPDPPDVWQKTLCWDNEDAEAVNDLTIIGAGIGGAYLANELRLSKKLNSSIAMMEAGPNVGGRLMSSFHTGALGMPARPFDTVNNVAPQEYGGMRINPNFPHVWNQVIKLWNKEFKDKAPKNAQCNREFCQNWDNVDLCCHGLLTPMNVGNIYYHNTNKKLGGRAMDSKLTDKNPLYTDDGGRYSYTDIEKHEEYSPFIQSLLLAVGADHYLNSLTHEESREKLRNTVATDGFKTICSSPACDTIPGMCDLCRLFPDNPAAAVMSCTGYDLSASKYSTKTVIDIADYVFMIKGQEFYYLFTVGYQRFAQSILSGIEVDNDDSGYQNPAVAPHFGKKLVAIGVGPGDFEEAVERANKLARRQVDRFLGVEVENDEEIGPTEPIQYLFSDGSMTNSHLSYLTMLPKDAIGSVKGNPTIRGFGPWFEQVNNNTNPELAFKAFIKWDEFSLTEELGMTPCFQINDAKSVSNKCDRIILDGNSDSQVVRQAWLWDHNQILLYTAGSVDTPSDYSINTAQQYGIERVVKTAIAELREAVKGIISKKTNKPIEIPDPSFFRGKSWPDGSLLVDWPVGKDSDSFSEHIRRPFGKDVNIWYGNSELDKSGGNHGWAEGALSMVETSLPEIEANLEKYTNKVRKKDTEVLETNYVRVSPINRRVRSIRSM